MTEDMTYAMLNTMGEMAESGSTQEEIDAWQVNYWLTNSAYFTVEHFDFHFNLHPVDFYAQITCNTFPPCADETGNTVIPEYFNAPAAEYIAPGYWPDPTSSVPGQGIHWEPTDIQTRDEFRAEPTRAYGTYDGQLMFLEAMYSTSNLRDVKANGEQLLDYVPGTAIQKFDYNNIYVPTQIKASYADEKYTIEFISPRLYTGYSFHMIK